MALNRASRCALVHIVYTCSLEVHFYVPSLQVRRDAAVRLYAGVGLHSSTLVIMGCSSEGCVAVRLRYVRLRCFFYAGGRCTEAESQSGVCKCLVRGHT